MYAGVGIILLPLQIERIDPAHKVAELGVVAGVSAVFALVFNPIGGALSDRTRSRFGRRAPWLVGASAGLLVMLVLLGQASAVPLILVAWCLAQAVANLYQAPLTAVVPRPGRPGAAWCRLLGRWRGWHDEARRGSDGAGGDQRCRGHPGGGDRRTGLGPAEPAQAVRVPLLGHRRGRLRAAGAVAVIPVRSVR